MNTFVSFCLFLETNEKYNRQANAEPGVSQMFRIYLCLVLRLSTWFSGADKLLQTAFFFSPLFLPTVRTFDLAQRKIMWKIKEKVFSLFTPAQRRHNCEFYFEYFDSIKCRVKFIRFFVPVFAIIICCCCKRQKINHFSQQHKWNKIFFSSCLLQLRSVLTALGGREKMEKWIKNRNVLFALYFLIFLCWMKCSPFHCLNFFSGGTFLFFILKLYLRLFIFIFGLFAATNGNLQFMHLYPERINWNKIEWSERLFRSLSSLLRTCAVYQRVSQEFSFAVDGRSMNDRRSLFTRRSIRSDFPYSWFAFPPHFYLSAYFFIDVTAKGILFFMIFPFIQFTTCSSFCFYACPSLFSFTPLIFFSPIFRWLAFDE